MFAAGLPFIATMAPSAACKLLDGCIEQTASVTAACMHDDVAFKFLHVCRNVSSLGLKGKLPDAWSQLPQVVAFQSFSNEDTVVLCSVLNAWPTGPNCKRSKLEPLVMVFHTLLL